MAGNVPFIKITYDGTVSEKNVGVYEVVCVCDDNCYFIDTGTNTCKTIWEINKCPLNSPYVDKKYPYTGEIIEPEFKGCSPDVLVISGDTRGIEIGDYTAFFDIRDKHNYEWASDVVISCKNNGNAAVGWEIVYSAETAQIPYQSNYLVYNGTNQSPAFKNYNQNFMTLIGGVPFKKNAGTYRVVFRLKDNCVWSDGTTDDKSAEWNIYKRKIPSPYIKASVAEGGIYYYEIEGKRYPVWQNYDPEIMTISGDMYDIDNRWHITFFDLKDSDNYVWDKIDSSDTYTVRWKLAEPYKPSHIPGSNDKKVHIPKQISVPYEDGTTKYPVWDKFDPNAIAKLGGVWEGITANTYYVLLEPHDGYVWEDGTYEMKTVAWNILAVGEEQPPCGLIIVHIPVQINVPYYDGLVKEPEWDEWDKFGIDVVEGDLYGMPAGTYYLTLRPQTGYMWEDGTVEDKVVTWVISPGEMEETPDYPISRDPAPERDDEGNSDDCCCACCCDTGLFDIFQNSCDDDSSCDCS